MYCFNCSNGVKINGVLFLKVDDVLLVNVEGSVLNVIDVVKERLFILIVDYYYFFLMFFVKFW